MNPVVVALLDTGVDCFHRDLNVVFSKSFVTPALKNGSDDNGDTKPCWDMYDHGTNVAGEHVANMWLCA